MEENRQIEAINRPQSAYSVYHVIPYIFLYLSMKKFFMPGFRLARSAHIKEFHKPRQEAHPLFQPPVKVLDQWHLGIKVPTGAVIEIDR